MGDGVDCGSPGDKTHVERGAAVAFPGDGKQVGTQSQKGVYRGTPPCIDPGFSAARLRSDPVAADRQGPMIDVAEGHPLEADVGGDVPPEARNNPPHSLELTKPFLENINNKPRVTGKLRARQVLGKFDEGGKGKGVITNAGPPQPIPF